MRREGLRGARQFARTSEPPERHEGPAGWRRLHRHFRRRDVSQDRARAENVEQCNEGCAIKMARRRWEAGLRDSPAKMAAYSNPQRAPKVILLKTLNWKRVSGGNEIRSGWYSLQEIRWNARKGRSAQNAMISTVKMLPTLVTHLPTRKPRCATSINRAEDRDGSSQNDPLVRDDGFGVEAKA